MTNVGKRLPIVINAHSGGGALLTAKDELSFICKLADQNDILFANLEYRKAPETKVPGAAEDMVAAIKYFANDPDKHNVDS